MEQTMSLPQYHRFALFNIRQTPFFYIQLCISHIRQRQKSKHTANIYYFSLVIYNIDLCKYDSQKLATQTSLLCKPVHISHTAGRLLALLCLGSLSFTYKISNLHYWNGVGPCKYDNFIQLISQSFSKLIIMALMLEKQHHCIHYYDSLLPR